MRLWHYKLIGVLPKSQLVAQWRELNAIFAKEDRHILINYVYDHPKEYLQVYAAQVFLEMMKRGYKVRSLTNYANYFKDCDLSFEFDEHYPEHDTEYLTVCYWNLREKWRRGQKDLTDDVWKGIEKVYLERWL